MRRTPWECTPRSSSPRTSPQHGVPPCSTAPSSCSWGSRNQHDRTTKSTQECPPRCQGCSEPSLSPAHPPTHTPTHATLPARGTWANVGQRDAVARTGEDGFVSVLGGTSRDLQLLGTDKVGWDFLQERTNVRETFLLLLASPRRGRAGDARLTQGPSRDVSIGDEPRPYPKRGVTPSREATLGEELGTAMQDRFSVDIPHPCLPTSPSLPPSQLGSQPPLEMSTPARAPHHHPRPFLV